MESREELLKARAQVNAEAKEKKAALDEKIKALPHQRKSKEPQISVRVNETYGSYASGNQALVTILGTGDWQVVDVKAFRSALKKLAA